MIVFLFFSCFSFIMTKSLREPNECAFYPYQFSTTLTPESTGEWGHGCNIKKRRSSFLKITNAFRELQQRLVTISKKQDAERDLNVNNRSSSLPSINSESSEASAVENKFFRKRSLPALDKTNQVVEIKNESVFKRTSSYRLTLRSDDKRDEFQKRRLQGRSKSVQLSNARDSSYQAKHKSFIPNKSVHEANEVFDANFNGSHKLSKTFQSSNDGVKIVAQRSLSASLPRKIITRELTPLIKKRDFQICETTPKFRKRSSSAIFTFTRVEENSIPLWAQNTLSEDIICLHSSMKDKLSLSKETHICSTIL